LSLNRYPDRGYRAVREALAERLEVEPGQVFCANGSNEVLLTLALGFGGVGRRSLVFEPTYSLHHHIASLVGGEVVTRLRDAEYRITLNDEIRHTLNESDVVYLCSPNNPTGIVESSSVIKEVVEGAANLVIVDEAYSDFARASRLPADALAPNVVSVRTFSKWYSLAGLRFGFSVSAPEIVDVLDEVVLPYHFDQVKQAAVLAALELSALFDERSATLASLRIELRSELIRLGVSATDSETNFMLLSFPGRDPEAIWRQLVDRSILLRNTAGWPHLPPSLRVTVGTKEENARLVEALAELLSHGG
jgi:histidinol-phosphate aminotransferase